MPSIITAGDASNGLVVASGNDGAVTIQSGLAGAKVNALSIAADGTPTWLRPPITLGTAVATTSGTSIDFTGIPAGVKRVTLMFDAVSANGTSNWLVRLGTSAGVASSGYLGAGAYVGSSTSGTNSTTGFIFNMGGSAQTMSGSMTFSLFNSATFKWVQQAALGDSSQAYIFYSAGAATLPAVLDRLRLTTVNGTDTFDAGSVNIMWEF